MLGGTEALWGRYLGAAAAAGLDRSRPLYVATGILSYRDADHQLEDVQKRLAPYSSSLVFKDQFLPAARLAALHPDQLAVIDFLVLVRSRAFVGLSASTFSVYIREFRHLMGIAPRATTALVDCTPVGSEPLFARAAVLPPGPGPGEEPEGAAGVAAAAAAADTAAEVAPPAWAAEQAREVAGAAAAAAKALGAAAQRSGAGGGGGSGGGSGGPAAAGAAAGAGAGGDALVGRVEVV
ncbi:MAG: hypothetical protein J3K34DRAFT_393492 [Monoraphidium minutum]|nr:MAG: hypothetical protein J3K34DRAFT_393492 [Monoraphidium minutum]